MSWISQLARPDILALESYTCPERSPEYARLHANELPWRSQGDTSQAGLNRYPDPQPVELISALAALYRVDPGRLLATRGTDEAIDLLVRAFCRAGSDAVLVCPPAFVMYAICARIQGAQVIEVPLRSECGFRLEPHALLERVSAQVKLVFLCSPNNPTGNLLGAQAVLEVADALAGRALLIVDEAYIEFAGEESLAQQLPSRPGLVVLRTLSKAHALAGARLGALLADAELLMLLRKIIAPFPLPQLTIEAALAALAPEQLRRTGTRIAALCAERDRLSTALAGLGCVRRVWPSDANFVLAQFRDAEQALSRARAARLLVRDARRYLHEAVRITVGTPEETERLLTAWR
jgi:histidinol-phosphate aminotransferase